jgi:hypothetical protein
MVELHQGDLGGATRNRFEAQGAGAGERVQHGGAAHGIAFANAGIAMAK